MLIKDIRLVEILIQTDIKYTTNRSLEFNVYYFSYDKIIQSRMRSFLKHHIYAKIDLD